MVNKSPILISPLLPPPAPPPTPWYYLQPCKGSREAPHSPTHSPHAAPSLLRCPPTRSALPVYFLSIADPLSKTGLKDSLLHEASPDIYSSFSHEKPPPPLLSLHCALVKELAKSVSVGRAGMLLDLSRNLPGLSKILVHCRRAAGAY